MLREALLSQRQAQTHHCPTIGCRVLALLIALLGICSYASAEIQKSPDGEPARSELSNLVDIKIETSRSQPTAGTGLGVIAEVKNLSKSMVYLRDDRIVLVLTPELEGSYAARQIGWYAYFPTEGTKYPLGEGRVSDRPYIVLNPGDTYKIFWAKNYATQAVKHRDLARARTLLEKALTAVNNIKNPSDRNPVLLTIVEAAKKTGSLEQALTAVQATTDASDGNRAQALQAVIEAVGTLGDVSLERVPEDNPLSFTGDVYSTMLDNSPSFIRAMAYTVFSELKFIFFPPGDYKISVVAQYWTDPQSLLTDKYRTSAQSTIIHVSAPQSVILFGAALGGVIAYLLFPASRFRLNNSRVVTRNRSINNLINFVVRPLTGIFLSMLLSAIVAILLARLAESQFLIRVTVADFWGAIAIGFLATYSGAQIFEKLLPPEAKREATLREPVIDEIIAEQGSLSLEIRGRNLSPKAEFQIDHETITLDKITYNPLRPDEQEDETTGFDLYKVLRLEIINHPKERDWQQGLHRLTLINPTGQKASWPFTVRSVVIHVKPAIAEIPVGHTQEFTAEVSGTRKSAVTWSINPPSVGNITPAGLYTAPPQMPPSPDVTIIATSQTDPTKSAAAAITITQSALSLEAKQRENP